MSYYHTARAHAKALKTFGEDNKRKAERRAEVANVQVAIFNPTAALSKLLLVLLAAQSITRAAVTQAEQPLNLLRVDGRPSKIIRSDEQYRAIESTEGMLPWNGHVDNLIDRFDGRALLDFYREPPPASLRRPKSDEDLELDEV